MHDKQLIAMLRQQEEPLADDGFTESLLARLPSRRNVRIQAAVFSLAIVLAAGLVLLLFPFELIPLISRQLVTTPWLATAAAAACSALSWMYARTVVDR